MSRRVVPSVCSALVLALCVAGLAPPAEARSFFTARRTFGALFLGGSVVMAKKAVSLRRDANDIYDAYKMASNAQDAERLFSRASDRDTKSQMSIGLSAVLLASGLRLLLASGVDDNIPKIDRRVVLDMTGDVRTQRVQVVVKKRF